LILDGLPHAAEEIGHLVALQDAFDRLPMLVVHPEGQRCPLEILQRRPCDRVESCLSVEGLTPRLLRLAICCAIHYGRCEQLLDALRKNDRELTVAREIQQSLFPKESPQVEGFDIAGKSFPTQEVGGDYYDFLSLPEDYLGIAIGDASGHGVGAALLSAHTRATLRSLAFIHQSVAEIISLANRVLSVDSPGGRFMTLLLARVNPRTGSFVYANAGHQPGFILSQDGHIQHQMETTGIPLGITPEWEFPHSFGYQLKPGDTVVFLTDGVVEASGQNDATFGRQRLVDLALAYRDFSAAEMISKIAQAVFEFCYPRLPTDDFTLVVIKVSPEICLRRSF